MKKPCRHEARHPANATTFDILQHSDKESNSPLKALLERVDSGDCIVLDVRPPEEYDAAHVAGALSMPRKEFERRLGELPRDRQIVAYCRGPYCVLAVNAVETLRRHGFDAVRAPESVEDWRELGISVIANG